MGQQSINDCQRLGLERGDRQQGVQGIWGADENILYIHWSGHYTTGYTVTTQQTIDLKG